MISSTHAEVNTTSLTFRKNNNQHCGTIPVSSDGNKYILGIGDMSTNDVKLSSTIIRFEIIARVFYCYFLLYHLSYTIVKFFYPCEHPIYFR